MLTNVHNLSCNILGVNASPGILDGLFSPIALQAILEGGHASAVVEALSQNEDHVQLLTYLEISQEEGDEIFLQKLAGDPRYRREVAKDERLLSHVFVSLQKTSQKFGDHY